MPLSATDIKVKILLNGDTIAGLARQWGTHQEALSRVIHRRGYFVYPELREKLAEYLEVNVSDVGREPLRPRTDSEPVAA